MWITVAQSSGSWTTKTITVIEELLLVLIILEIFVTVLAYLEGGRLQLEPFIIVGVIAVVRHILSVVVRLAVSMTAAESRAVDRVGRLRRRGVPGPEDHPGRRGHCPITPMQKRLYSAADLTAYALSADAFPKEINLAC
jgi:phosphate-starvation-inducible protein E